MHEPIRRQHSRTFEEKERDWREMVRALHLAFYGPELLVPALSSSRLQDPSKPSQLYLNCNERSCGLHVPFRREYLEQFKDVVWGPGMNLGRNALNAVHPILVIRSFIQACLMGKLLVGLLGRSVVIDFYITSRPLEQLLAWEGFN